jgi:hypothetical protein
MRTHASVPAEHFQVKPVAIGKQKYVRKFQEDAVVTDASGPNTYVISS